MKSNFLTNILILFLVMLSNINCKELREISYTSEINDTIRIEKQLIMEQFANVLTKQKKKCPDAKWLKFFVEKGKAHDYFVFDIVDTTNYEFLNNKVELIDNHIYHFSAIIYEFGISNICILSNGKAKIFKAINCKKFGDNIDDVFMYIDTINYKLSLKEEIIDRLKNYKEFSCFVAEDIHTHPCCKEY